MTNPSDFSGPAYMYIPRKYQASDLGATTAREVEELNYRQANSLKFQV